MALPGFDLGVAADRLCTTLRRLDLRWQYRAQLATGIGRARANVWSRAARRKKQEVDDDERNEDEDDDDDDDDDDEEEAALAFQIRLQNQVEGQERPDGEMHVLVRWLEGRDSVMFESFCGMLKRSLKD